MVFDIEEMVGSRSCLSCAVERNVARSHIVERGLVGMSWVEREEERREERRRGQERREEERREEATSVHRELATGGEYSAVGGKGRSQMGGKNNRVGYIHKKKPKEVNHEGAAYSYFKSLC